MDVGSATVRRVDIHAPSGYGGRSCVSCGRQWPCPSAGFKVGVRVVLLAHGLTGTVLAVNGPYLWVEWTKGMPPVTWAAECCEVVS